MMQIRTINELVKYINKLYIFKSINEIEAGMLFNTLINYGDALSNREKSSTFYLQGSIINT